MTAPSLRTAPQRWHRALWLAAGGLALAAGIVGIFLPLLPATPFVLLAAYCFSRGSARCERWLLEHPRFGPMVRDWRMHRAMPLRAKQTAIVMMAFGSAWAWWLLPPPWSWLPAACCTLVALWMWRLPTRAEVRAGKP
ncbi:MAG: YbaN family protein [Methylibium sp.]|nr:YbaN family protein [Methylibium sp.]